METDYMTTYTDRYFDDTIAYIKRDGKGKLSIKQLDELKEFYEQLRLRLDE